MTDVFLPPEYVANMQKVGWILVHNSVCISFSFECLHSL